jgi:hypothetical protein
MATVTQIPLPSLIRASAWDAGNASMRAVGRVVWSQDDADAASGALTRLVAATYGEGRIGFIRFGFAEEAERLGLLRIGMRMREFTRAYNDFVAGMNDALKQRKAGGL